MTSFDPRARASVKLLTRALVAALLASVPLVAACSASHDEPDVAAVGSSEQAAVTRCTARDRTCIDEPRPGTPRPGTPRPGTPKPGTPRPFPVLDAGSWTVVDVPPESAPETCAPTSYLVTRTDLGCPTITTSRGAFTGETLFVPAAKMCRYTWQPGAGGGEAAADDDGDRAALASIAGVARKSCKPPVPLVHGTCEAAGEVRVAGQSSRPAPSDPPAPRISDAPAPEPFTYDVGAPDAGDGGTGCIPAGLAGCDSCGIVVGREAYVTLPADLASAPLLLIGAGDVSFYLPHAPGQLSYVVTPPAGIAFHEGQVLGVVRPRE